MFRRKAPTQKVTVVVDDIEVDKVVDRLEALNKELKITIARAHSACFELNSKIADAKKVKKDRWSR